MYDKNTDYVVAQIHIVDFCWYLTFFLNDTSRLLCFVDLLIFFFIWLVHYTTIFDHLLTKSR